VREDLPDDHGIVQRGDQAQPAPAMGTRQHVDAKRSVHQGRPAPGAYRDRLAMFIEPDGQGPRPVECALN